MRLIRLQSPRINKVQVGATGITASLFNMVAGGQNLSIVADKGREQKGYSSSAVVMRTDLWEAGAKKIEDLKENGWGLPRPVRLSTICWGGCWKPKG